MLDKPTWIRWSNAKSVGAFLHALHRHHEDPGLFCPPFRMLTPSELTQRYTAADFVFSFQYRKPKVTAWAGSEESAGTDSSAFSGG